jgi:flagellin
MSQVALTAAMRANLLSLQGTAALLDQTQLRIATGNKVNSALDNPSSYFAAQALTNRSTDLTTYLDGMGQALSVLKAADNGISELTNLVTQAQAIATAALGAVSNTGGQETSGDIDVARQANLTSAGGFNAAGTDRFTLLSNGVAKGTVTIGIGMTLAQLVAQINSFSGVSAQIVAASAGAAAGSVRIQLNATSGETLTLTNATGTPVATLGTAMSAGGVVGTSLAGGVVGAWALTGVAVAANGTASDYVTRQTQFNAVRTQIDNLMEDAGYGGINLLNGSNMTTILNELKGAAQNTLTTTGVTYTSSNLGIAAADFTTAGTINTALANIETALANIRLQASTFGQNLAIIQTRQDFTKNVINLLNEGSSKLILADKNEEAANMLSLQTSQQLGIQALSLASQASQSILRLFA